MNHESQNLSLELLRLGLGTDAAVSIQVTDSIPWKEIFEEGTKQGIAAIQLDGLQILRDAGCIASELMPTKTDLLSWYSHTMQVEEKCRHQKRIIRQLAEFYHDHGIKMMLLKGYAISLLYPTLEHRPCGDIDIWLYGEQERADKLLEEDKNIAIERDHHHHTVFHVGGIVVENHYNFVNIHSHLSNRIIEKELHSLVRQEHESLDVDGMKVFFASADFNALFLLYHAAMHFAASEIAMRHVTDWAMFIKHYHDRVDWKHLDSIARELNFHRFLYCLNAICVDYLGMPKEYFHRCSEDRDLIKRVLDDILYPPYANKSALGKNVIRDLSFRIHRWWGNRWKRHLVYKESSFVSFWIQLRSHLIKPEGKQVMQF